MKRFVSFVFIILIIAVVGIVVAPNFIDWNSYKNQATAEIKKHTDFDMDIKGNLSLAILPSPRFIIEDVAIKGEKHKQYPQLLTFDRLDIAVSLMPLLKGQVKVDAITLNRPVITVEKFKDGSLNAMTTKLSQPSETQTQSSGTSSALDIALDNITIKEGVIAYYDHATSSEQKIQNINADLSAKALSGPYSAKGSLFYNANAVNFDVKTDAYDQTNEIISPNIVLTLQPSGVKLSYNGVVGLASDDLSVQGKMKIAIDNLQTLAKEGFKPVSIEVQGLLTADAKQVSYKDLDLKIGETPLKASLSAQLDPLSYELIAKTEKNINLQTILKDNEALKTAKFDVLIKGSDKIVDISKAFLTINGNEMKLSGQYAGSDKARAKAKLNISATTLNVDDFMQGEQSNDSSSSMKETIKGLAMPIDATIQFHAQKLIWQKKEIKSLKTTAQFAQDAFKIKSLSVENIGGASFKSASAFTNLNATPQIEGYVDLTMPEIKKLMAMFDMDSASLPDSLKRVALKTKFSGTMDNLNVTTNINAMGGELITKGGVLNPFETMSLSDLAVQIKHKNMAKAIESLSGSPLNDKNLTRPLDLYAKVSQQGNKYSLADIKGDLSGMSVKGALDVNTGSDVPSIKGDLTFGKIKLEALAEQDTQSKTRWSKDPIDASVLHTINADIALKAQSIEYGEWPLKNPSLALKLKAGNLSISNLKAGVFGGSMDTSMNVKTVAKPRQPIQFESDAAFNNVDVGQLTKTLVGTELVNISGKGGLDMNTKTSGASVAAMILDLSGQGIVKGSNMTLQGVDVTRFVKALSEESKPGDTLSGLWGGATKGGSTQFDTLEGGFLINNGVVNLNNIKLDGKKASIETQGEINLPNWTLSTKHKMSVKGTDETPSDVPPFEMTFKGSLDNPTQTFGQGLLNDYLNRKIERKLNKFLSDKLGVSPKKPANDNQKSELDVNDKPTEQQEKPSPKDAAKDAAKDAIKGVLDGLLR